MATRVWLLRHGQTSRPDVFHGFESDVELSELGHRQAAAAASVIADWPVEVLISSNMLRARQTVQPIAAACGLPVRIEPLLHERKVGGLAGMPAQSGLGIWPDTLEQWIAGNTAYAPEGSESFDALQARLMPVWERIVSEYCGKATVIVCHGIVCRVLLLSILKRPVSDWMRLGHVSNLAISELFEEDGKWQAVTLAEVPGPVRELSQVG